MSWLEDKRERWRLGITEVVGERAAVEVLDGWDDLVALEPPRRAEWMIAALGRLERVMPNEAARRAFLKSVSCTYVEEFGSEPLMRMRELYRRTGDIADVVAEMSRLSESDGEPNYPPYVYMDGCLEVTKDCCDPEALEHARTPRERRAAVCYCPLVRQAEGKVPGIYCNCGAGWTKGIWEFILERPVRVEVTASVLRGDEASGQRVCL